MKNEKKKKHLTLAYILIVGAILINCLGAIDFDHQHQGIGDEFMNAGFIYSITNEYDRRYLTKQHPSFVPYLCSVIYKTLNYGQRILGYAKTENDVIDNYFRYKDIYDITTRIIFILFSLVSVIVLFKLLYNVLNYDIYYSTLGAFLLISNYPFILTSVWVKYVAPTVCFGLLSLYYSLKYKCSSRNTHLYCAAVSVGFAMGCSVFGLYSLLILLIVYVMKESTNCANDSFKVKIDLKAVVSMIIVLSISYIFLIKYSYNPLRAFARCAYSHISWTSLSKQNYILCDEYNNGMTGWLQMWVGGMGYAQFVFYCISTIVLLIKIRIVNSTFKIIFIMNVILCLLWMYLMRDSMRFLYYVLYYMPIMIIFSVVSLKYVYDRHSLFRRLKYVIPIILVMPNMVRINVNNYLLNQKNTGEYCWEWVMDNVPPGSNILQRIQSPALSIDFIKPNDKQPKGYPKDVYQRLSLARNYNSYVKKGRDIYYNQTGLEFVDNRGGLYNYRGIVENIGRSTGRTDYIILADDAIRYYDYNIRVMNDVEFTRALKEFVARVEENFKSVFSVKGVRVDWPYTPAPRISFYESLRYIYDLIILEKALIPGSNIEIYEVEGDFIEQMEPDS